MKRLLFLPLLASLIAVDASAEAPYVPRQASPSQLIQAASYDEVPIQISMFPLVATRSVAAKGRIDFEQTYDVMVWDFVKSFEDAAEKQAAVAMLDASVFPNANHAELRVYGKGHHGEEVYFTLGHPDLPYTFRITVRGDDQSKAVVVIRNAVFAKVYGGTMPARVGFKPAGDGPTIPFLWE